MADCPKCCWPGTPPDDEAFYFRYKLLPPEKKLALRKMAKVLMESTAPETQSRNA